MTEEYRLFTGSDEMDLSDAEERVRDGAEWYLEENDLTPNQVDFSKMVSDVSDHLGEDEEWVEEHLTQFMLEYLRDPLEEFMGSE